MQKTIGFFFFCLWLSSLSAQPFTFVKQWDKRFGGTDDDALISLCQTSNGDYILSGASRSGVNGDKTEPSWNGSIDGWNIKIDGAGNKIWDKRFGGVNGDNTIKAQQTFDGGYIFGGSTGSGIGGDITQPSRGGYDYRLVKSDANGNMEWDKRFGGGGDDNFCSVLQTTDSGYIITGYSNSGIGGDKTEYIGDYDFWIVKTDANGIKQWDRTLGGSGRELMNTFSLCQTLDGGYITGGLSKSDSSGNKTQNSKGGNDYWAIKLDAQGNIIWDKDLGGASEDILGSILATKDGGFVLGGYSASDTSADKTQMRIGGEDYWLIKFDSASNKVWDKIYGGSQADELYTLTRTMDGGYLMAGRSTSPANGDKTETNLGAQQPWLVKTDSAGNKQWDKTIFINGLCYNIYAIQSNDGCYVVGTDTRASIGGYRTQANWDTTNQTYDYWIMKFCMDTFTSIDNGQQTTDDSKIQIQTYPNPFTTDLSIALKGENIHEATFTITNTIGQVIYKREESNLASNYTKVLDLSYLPNGIYFVEVSSGGENMVKRVVKE